MTRRRWWWCRRKRTNDLRGGGGDGREKNGAKGGSERERGGKRRKEHDDPVRSEEARGTYGTKGTSAARGFGLARSTRYPFSACVSPESSLPVLASIRTSPPLPLRPAVRAPARSRTLPLFPPLFCPHPSRDLTAWRATIAIAKPPLSCRLVPLPYLRSPTRRRDGDASRRASLRSRHGDVTLSSVVQ